MSALIQLTGLLLIVGVLGWLFVVTLPYLWWVYLLAIGLVMFRTG
jgi:hypothetical protein